jgi:hypothetical protein
MAVGLFVVAAGVTIGLRPLTDNSFFTHLATGRLILDRGSVPTHDPYTFSAAGEPWVVQSWLASWLYATVEALVGAVGLRVLMGAVAGGLAAVIWRLTRPAEGVVARLIVAGLAVGVGGELWAERPFMLGLLALGCVVLAADGALDPRWLVPVGWVWANVHGSFPLGIAYLVVVAAGYRMDGGRPVRELRALLWALVGIVAGVVGPLGLRVLSFPAELLGRQEVLRNVIEWRAPTFDAFSQRLFVLQLAVAVVLLVRRPSYRSALVIAVFGAAALLSARNVTVASLVIVPAMAAAAPQTGSLRSAQRPRLAGALGVIALAVMVLLGAARLDQRDYELRGYPIDGLAYLQDTGIDLAAHRLATQDVVGNVQELLYGASGRVFYDDRFDMFPEDVTQLHLALVQGAPRLRRDLEVSEIELVLWDRTTALAQRLVVDPSWRVLYSDERAVVVCHRGAALGGTIGRC